MKKLFCSGEILCAMTIKLEPGAENQRQVYYAAGTSATIKRSPVEGTTSISSV